MTLYLVCYSQTGLLPSPHGRIGGRGADVGQWHARTTAAWWCSLLFAFPGPAVVPAAGQAPARAVGRFQQVTLAKGIAEVGEPMSMTVLPDRSILHTSRDGTIRRTDAAGNTRV